MLNGLSQINLEITSRCDKSCSFCGHQDPSINIGLSYGDMNQELFESILEQLPRRTIVQLHRDGEPLIYPDLKFAMRSLAKHGMIVSIVTNGKKLIEKQKDLIGWCDTITVSVFHGDPDGPEQYEILSQFLDIKRAISEDLSPQVLIKIVGDMPEHQLVKYKDLRVPILRRLIHVPLGDMKYAHRDPMIPEIGICLDFLHHPSVDWQGNFYICNRLDPNKDGYLGNLYKNSLEELWNSDKRMEWLKMHLKGRRDLAAPLCRDCRFWGVPSG